MKKATPDEEFPSAVTFQGDAVRCCRCGRRHADMVFQRIPQPVLTINGYLGYTHFAECPDGGGPVLIRVNVTHEPFPKEENDGDD